MNPKLHYLIVDDYEPIRRMVMSQFLSQGVKTIYEAKDGRQAIDILDSKDVDVVICDWNMPNVTGIDVLRHVRSSERFAETHFMFITAEAEQTSVLKAIEEGVDEFLVKPFTPAKLKEKIKSMLSRPPRKPMGASMQSAEAVTETGEASISLPSQVSGPPTLVIIDDVPSNIDVFREVLKNDYKIKAATSGAKGIALIKSTQPALILLDIMMPDMDGYAVCTQLKEDLETEHIPIIFLTTKSEVVDMTQGFALGAVDYITKPVHSDILKARVKTHVQLKQARDEMAYQIQNLMDVAKLREDVERMTRHDLKNPLTAILNKSEHLIEDAYLHVEQRKDIETIRDAAYDVLGMINRSLDVFKMETGSYELKAEALDISDVALKVVNESRINARELGVSILFEAPEPVIALGEQILCFSILSNLLKNAVEASASDTNVVVTLESNEDMVMVSIHNDGVIPEDIRESFFDKYVTHGKDKGTGIGTYSAKLMANAQQGDVTFESDEKSGTTLTFSLPLDTESR